MIKILTDVEMQRLVSGSEVDPVKRRIPLGLFLSHEHGKWVACDNSGGDAWTEEFDTLEDAVDWLNSDESKEEFEERKRRLRKPAFQDPDEPTDFAYTGDKIPEVQRPRKQEPPKPKDPLDTPATKMDLYFLACALARNHAISQDTKDRFLKWMKGEPNV